MSAKEPTKNSDASGNETGRDCRLGGKDETVEVVVERGETIWQLSELKYEGKHPLAAIFQANGLRPSVVYENGLRRLLDPVYFAGNVYIFPAWSEVERLEKEFYSLMDELHPQVESYDEYNICEAGSVDDKQRSFVTINWDETLYAVAQRKYGSDVPLEAIYEINNMTPSVSGGTAGKTVKEPVYPGGKTYWLPARSEVDTLTEKYKERVKELL
ncbi:MAG: hypothetical protein DKT66_09940 [Candidatus Melainabacteria bacterium]|nr:MAG: hypothetical protein DKT66_09940 [Candidatus Melainabacteria bacterium]